MSDKSGLSDQVLAAMQGVKSFTREKEVQFEEITSNSNFNYLYKCKINQQQYFLKVLMAAPKALKKELPAERVLGEIRGINTFNITNKGARNALAPEVISYDEENCALLLSDIGGGRFNLADLENKNTPLLASESSRLALATGRWHSMARHGSEIHDFGYEEDLRAFIFQSLIAPGIKEICGDSADSVLGRMLNTRECLIHSDLWAKNIFVGETKDVALIDFEGCIVGDPCFDLSTLLAMSLYKILDVGEPLSYWESVANSILKNYFSGLNDPAWKSDIMKRIYPYLGVMIACRLFGPFPYVININREPIANICRSLVAGEISEICGIADYFDEIACV
ncbi:MAG: hypothetical protein COA42_14335 [Alteromonadaceae bacterium]|nr:MAG: hypothetical protein COA42_14335 [Alteromonadaceae bacterium]